MLIEKKVKIGEVAAVRLVSGEEVVGKVKSLEDTKIEVTKPLVIGMQQQQNPSTGQVEVGMGFAPFMLSLTDDGSVSFDLSNAVTVVKARKEISDAYLQSTSSLEVPSGPGLVI